MNTCLKRFICQDQLINRNLVTIVSNHSKSIIKLTNKLNRGSQMLDEDEKSLNKINSTLKRTINDQ
jgi:hypothetical protein